MIISSSDAKTYLLGPLFCEMELLTELNLLKIQLLNPELKLLASRNTEKIKIQRYTDKHSFEVEYLLGEYFLFFICGGPLV